MPSTNIKHFLATLIIFYSCHVIGQTNSREYLPIYTYKEVTKNDKAKMIAVIDTVLLLEKSYSIQEKVELVAKTVSKRFFRGLRINLELVKDDKEGDCLNINLIENEDGSPYTHPSWHQYFQGSTGGAQTEQTLISNFLQKHYKGNWVDRIVFFYEGEEMEDWDHVWLSKHNRYDFDD